MIKVFKTRIYPNKTQENIIRRTLGSCRFVKNLYINKVGEYYKLKGEFLSGYDFSKRLNKEKKKNDDIKFLNDISSKAIKQAIMEEEKVFMQYFKKIKKNEKCHYPRFISRKFIRHESYFFIKDNISYISNHIIKLPILGKIRISESLSTFPDIYNVTSGRIIRNDDKFYIMLIYNIDNKNIQLHDYGLGVDIGIENYATIAFSNTIDRCIKIPSFIKDDNYKKKEERYNKILKAISRKAEINYNRLYLHYLDTHNSEEPNETDQKILRKESYYSTRINKLRNKSRKAYKDLVNYRINSINNIVYNLTAKLKPCYITIENLSIQNMLSTFIDNTPKELFTKLHKYIQNSGFYMFKVKLIDKCHEYNIELRMSDKYFASSKICCRCGNKKKDLKLSDRLYKCDNCGLEIDRDSNASINLVILDDYNIA